MAQNQNATESALEIDRLATQLARDPYSKAFMPLAEEYAKVGMWQEAAAVLEDGLIQSEASPPHRQIRRRPLAESFVRAIDLVLAAITPVRQR